jgi:glycosyltransferase involved in cell wall biosynthesis
MTTTLQPLRILQLVGNLDASGAETVVVNLANGLSDLGHDVSVCSRKTGQLAPRVRVPLDIVPKNGTVDWKYVRELSALVRRRDVDIIHSHLFGSDLDGFMVATITNRALVSTIHGADAIRTAKRRLAYHVIARKADRVVVVSEALQAHFSNRRIRQDVDLVLNGVPFPVASMAGDQKRVELGLRPDQLVVGAVGNIKRVKGFEVLIAAFETVKARRKDAVLLVAGANEDQAYWNELHALIAQHHLGGSVRLLGGRSDVSELLKVFDVYVVASHYEGTSLALLEAMTAGLPIVATDVGGNAAVIQNGQSGLLVPCGEPAPLAEAIVRLAGDADVAGRLGRAASDAATSQYSLDAMVRRYETLFREVMRARQKAHLGSRFRRASC